jgi:hypothetical protein
VSPSQLSTSTSAAGSGVAVGVPGPGAGAAVASAMGAGYDVNGMVGFFLAQAVDIKTASIITTTAVIAFFIIKNSFLIQKCSCYTPQRRVKNSLYEKPVFYHSSRISRKQ